MVAQPASGMGISAGGGTIVLGALEIAGCVCQPGWYEQWERGLGHMLNNRCRLPCEGELSNCVSKLVLLSVICGCGEQRTALADG